MNSLSWFLYFADVVGSLATFTGVAGSLLIMSSIPMVISGKFVPWANPFHTYDPEEVKKARTLIGNFGIGGLAMGFLLVLMSTLIPSKQTMYMIAASEIGETVVTDPKNAEIIDELRNSILYSLRSYQEKKNETK